MWFMPSFLAASVGVLWASSISAVLRLFLCACWRACFATGSVCVRNIFRVFAVCLGLAGGLLGACIALGFAQPAL